MTIKVENKYIGDRQPAFIIAEISANHGQSLKRARSLINIAKECGVDAVKFQTYTPDTITIDVSNKFFKVNHPVWGGQTLYNLYQKAYTPWSWFKQLKQLCDDLGIVFFSTAFDRTAIDFLEDLDVPVHKIASFELVDLPLIEYAAKTKKPLIMSTGMASMAEIKEAVEAAKEAGAKDIILLKCVSNYPAQPDQMNLGMIGRMRRDFNCPVGFSDHSLEPAVAIAAVCQGAVVVERHFTSSRKRLTPDSFFSTEPAEMKKLVEEIRMVELAVGSNSKTTLTDKKSKVFRRSLFVVQDIKKGELFSQDNVRSIRPAYGLAPKYWKQVIDKRAVKNIKKGTPLKWAHIEAFNASVGRNHNRG